MKKATLGLPILISLVVGNMIGTGIYVLPASLAGFGTISLFAWVFTALGAIFLALTFANLNKRFPKTGGPYAYCKEAYGRMGGFIVAYTYWLGNSASIAGIAVASIGYLGFITPLLNANTDTYNPYLALCIELGVIWLFTLINIVGVHIAGVVQLILTIIKLIPLILIVVLGFGSIHLANIEQFTIGNENDFSAITSAAALTFWAFVGLEAATIPAENTRGSADIYKATVYGTLITAVIYIVTSFVLMGMIPVTQLKNSQYPFALAGTLLFGAHGAFLIAICAVISGIGALNVCVLIQGQIIYAAARDGLFPTRLAKLSKNNTPVAGQIFSSSMVSGFLILTMEPTLLKQFNNIALMTVLICLTTYLATMVAEIKFQFQEHKTYKQLFMSKSFWIAFVAAAYAMWMISNFSLKLIMLGIGMIMLCVPIYYFTLKKRKFTVIKTSKLVPNMEGE